MPFIIASRFYFVAIICHKGVDGPAIDIYMGCFRKGGMVIERMGAGADFFKKALAFAIFPPLVFVLSLVADHAGAETESAAATIADLELAKSEAGRTPIPLDRARPASRRQRFENVLSWMFQGPSAIASLPWAIPIGLSSIFLKAGWQLPRALPSNKGAFNHSIRPLQAGATRVVIDVKGPVSVAKAFRFRRPGALPQTCDHMRPVSQEVFRHEATSE